MAELRYRMTGLLEEECKRCACIEQASLHRIAELESTCIEVQIRSVSVTTSALTLVAVEFPRDHSNERLSNDKICKHSQCFKKPVCGHIVQEDISYHQCMDCQQKHTPHWFIRCTQDVQPWNSWPC
ncbi:unnamed protein product [Prunus brigantina]